MAGRSSTTYQKRQKELARQDKKRAKAARREQRKLERQDRPPGLPEIASPDEWFVVPGEENQ
jgi:hypothetical protein